jgi:hypothetical protein
VVLYFGVPHNDSLLLPVSRASEGTEPVRLVSAAVTELLSGPQEDSGLFPVLEEGDSSSLSGVSVEGNQVYISLNGDRPSEKLLRAVALTVLAQNFGRVAIMWGEEWLVEEQFDTPVNALSKGASARVFLPVAVETEENRRLYLLPVTVEEGATPTEAVHYVLAAVGGQNSTEETLGELVPALFREKTPKPSVEVVEGTATVDFSHETVEAYAGGAAGEAALLESLTLTLTHFPEIDQVFYTLDGSPTTRLFVSPRSSTAVTAPLYINPE